MAATAELVGNDRDSHQEIMALSLQKLVESLGRVEALLKVLVESQVNASQFVKNTGVVISIDEEKHKTATNPSSLLINPLHHPDLASTSSTLLTPEEDTIITTATTDNLSAIMEKPSTVNDNKDITQVIHNDHNDQIEKSAGDGEQVTTKVYLDGYQELYCAAIKSDWKVAKIFLEKNPEAITKVITSDSQTVLHVAVIEGNLMFIEEIVSIMPPEILEYRTRTSGYTALHYAAMYGFAKAAEVMVCKTPNLPQIVNGLGRVPLDSALTSVTAGQRETVEYLYSVTRHEHPSPFSGSQGESLLCRTIDAGFYDIASSIVQRFPELIIDQTKKVQTKAMDYMAERQFMFPSGAQLTFWQRCIYSLVEVDINITYGLDTRTNKSSSSLSSEVSLPQSLKGTNGDEENPVERFYGPCRGGKNPPENSDSLEIVVKCLSAARIMVLLIIKLYVFLRRFIWSPVTIIKELYKQLYDDKVKHKQAEALVHIIFTTLKERMNKVEIIDFFRQSNVMKLAIRHGSVEFVEVCIQLFPFLIWYEMGGQSMIQMAIAERNETILYLICKESGKEKLDLVTRDDGKGNTILHYAAKLAPAAHRNSIPGAYLQMQREMQWLKGVENMISEKNKFKKNENGDTAHDIFTKEHKDLKESGEKWFKDTSGSCMLVAALIATVAFASSFTVPGGYISDSKSSKNGIPVFLGKNLFMVFAVADAFALFSSLTSVLMFLAVYTSRYTEFDFLESLPQKLILGLATLYISMASVLIAFSASLFIVLGEIFTWALIPIVGFSCVPVILIARLKLPLFFDMIRCTYWRSILREHTYISSLQLNAKKLRQKT
ncbi:uncharacterized protein LOC113327796 isoform X1 [Papaver somniferum]|uniref:uncharacterized protein LOC113327796 isoform X1 n=1 Tax=Papaver somniferum TaxID=3469 RepID=UPI000E6F7FC1|nr:uncharacterized protein LOC113327796 isoform X1 [Papaver somniferum]